MGTSPRILLFDIETAPSLGYVWGKWEQNVIDFKRQWFILSFAYKWLGGRSIYVHALPDFPQYARDRECDKPLLGELWKLFDAADVVVAHNGDKFDVRKSNARFLAHGFEPPSPYKQVDTLKIAKKHFQFDSNKLDDLGKYLGVGRKLPHTGPHLWFGCMGGDKKAWALMRRYNATDVALLERVYLKLRPWTTTHPNLSLYSRQDACPVCQSKRHVHKGWNYLRLGKKQRHKCLDCGHRYVTGAIIRDDAPLRSNRGR